MWPTKMQAKKLGETKPHNGEPPNLMTEPSDGLMNDSKRSILMEWYAVQNICTSKQKRGVDESNTKSWTSQAQLNRRLEHPGKALKEASAVTVVPRLEAED